MAQQRLRCCVPSRGHHWPCFRLLTYLLAVARLPSVLLCSSLAREPFQHSTSIRCTLLHQQHVLNALSMSCSSARAYRPEKVSARFSRPCTPEYAPKVMCRSKSDEVGSVSNGRELVLGQSRESQSCFP